MQGTIPVTSSKKQECDIKTQISQAYPALEPFSAKS